jgi:ankyrin repeat protein
VMVTKLSVIISTFHIPLPQQEGNTPLMYAASVGHSDIMVFLAEKGVKLEDKNEVCRFSVKWQ